VALAQWQSSISYTYPGLHARSYEIFIGSWKLMDCSYQNGNSTGKEIKLESSKIPL